MRSISDSKRTPTCRCHPWLRQAAVLAFIGVFGGLPLQAKRTDDVIVMKDGDKFTGEIKKLENGTLYFKSSYMVSSVQLDWALVDRLESQDPYNVTFSSGLPVNGMISVAQGSGILVFETGGKEFQHILLDVVGIVPVEATFWAQLTGSVDYGFSFTSGNNVTQSTLSSGLAYQAQNWRVQVSGNSVFNTQSNAATSGRNNIDFVYLKSVTEHWFLGSTGTLLNSEQQDLTLRSTLGGVLGRDFIRHGTTGLFVVAGAVFSREQYASSVSSHQFTNAAEAQIQVRFFKSKFKKMQFETKSAAFPSITTPGRFRLSLESSIRLELVKNLYWKFAIYENFDNRPPVNAPKNDFGTSTSFGFTF
jgi:hypothetical protein